MIQNILALLLSICPASAPSAVALDVATHREAAHPSPELPTKADAEAHEASGELALARDVWLELAPTLPAGEERDAVVARARSLDARLAVRAEICVALPNDERVFGELGITKADERGIVFATKRMPWQNVPLEVLSRASAASHPSRNAGNGILFEALARGNDAERLEALSDMGKRFERGEIDPVDAFAAVARARSERLPKKGYVFQKGEWTSAAIVEETVAASGLEDAAHKLETALPAQRAAALAALAAFGPEAVERTATALRVRWNECGKSLAHATSSIAPIAELRRELDVRRKKALDLIFDEVRYFYPYTPPECPQEKIKLYAPVQQEVDTLVARVRDTWKNSRRASQSAALRSALDELDWNRAEQKPRKLAFALAEGVPAWVDGLDRTADLVDVRTFAWDAKERAIFTRNVQVEALNARMWERKGTDPARAASSEEQKQVQVTNEYRRMFARGALAWNPKLQVSAQGHSDYMANTGDFGHYESDPTRKTPGDRMRLAGYVGGAGENCSLGDTSAEGAHDGWIHSSGHHRNILTPTHQEMASAQASIYWTQNFGGGREFEKELAGTKP